MTELTELMPDQTYTDRERRWHIPLQNVKVLVSGYQSWSEAELRPIGDVQARPTLDVLVRQGHDVAWPPGSDRVGEAGVWRSHTLIALVGGGGDGWVGCALDAGESFSHWEARDGGDHVELSYTCEGEPQGARLAYGENIVELIEEMAADLGQKMGALQPAPLRVWCSWYSYYRGVTFAAFVDEARAARELDLPFDVFQLDDGFQADLGDWTLARPGFGGHARDVPGELRALGYRAGIWLAPFVARPTSRLFQDHPEWFVRGESGEPVNCGDNWGGAYYGLDTARADVQGWLSELAREVTSWGYDYLKLDFLFGASLPGVRQGGASRTRAYRLGLEALRRGAGNAFLLGCGAPLAQSAGLLDAMRIGPDVAPYWDEGARRLWLGDATGPSARNAVHTSLSRWYQHHWYSPDPDVVIARRERSLLSPAERGALGGLLDVIGGVRASSDPLRALGEAELAELRSALEFSAPDRPLSLTDTLGAAPTRFLRGAFNLLDEAEDGVPAHGFRPNAAPR